MTRRPFIVVCPETGRADVRTHKGENSGSYWLTRTSNPDPAWTRYQDGSPRGLHEWASPEIARLFLSLAHPVPADAVWGPGTEVEDDPKPTTPGAYSDGYRAGIAQSAAIIDSLRARVMELEAKETANG